MPPDTASGDQQTTSDLLRALGVAGRNVIQQHRSGTGMTVGISFQKALGEGTLRNHRLLPAQYFFESLPGEALHRSHGVLHRNPHCGW